MKNNNLYTFKNLNKHQAGETEKDTHLDTS